MSTITDNFIPITQISLRRCLHPVASLSMYFLSVIAVYVTLVILYSQRTRDRQNVDELNISVDKKKSHETC